MSSVAAPSPRHAETTAPPDDHIHFNQQQQQQESGLQHDPALRTSTFNPRVSAFISPLPPAHRRRSGSSAYDTLERHRSVTFGHIQEIPRSSEGGQSSDPEYDQSSSNDVNEGHTASGGGHLKVRTGRNRAHSDPSLRYQDWFRVDDTSKAPIEHRYTPGSSTAVSTCEGEPARPGASDLEAKALSTSRQFNGRRSASGTLTRPVPFRIRRKPVPTHSAYSSANPDVRSSSRKLHSPASEENNEKIAQISRLTSTSTSLLTEKYVVPSVKWHPRVRPRNGAADLLRQAWKVVWTPRGVLVTVYIGLICAWGATLFFLIMGWVNMELMARFQWIEICIQVLTALFAITSLGFLPWRLRDTYHIIIVADYAHLARVRIRKQLSQKILGTQPPNELSGEPPATDFERGLLQRQESTVILVLKEKERRQLRKSAKILASSQTWFKPLGNLSHRSTSLTLAVIIIVLNDANSVFQAVLCGYVWGVSPIKRPILPVLICLAGAAISSVAAGILIWVASRQGRKTVDQSRTAYNDWSRNEYSRNLDIMPRLHMHA